MADMVKCGTCGREFEDIYPAGRCPFEYDHPEQEEPVNWLDELIDRSERAIETLKTLREDCVTLPEKKRLSNKIKGADLILSYAYEIKRTGRIVN